MTPSPKILLALGAILTLSACGGRGDNVSVARSYATGPMQTACLRADRKSADQALCGCVQAAADSSLSRRDQALAVKFFKDPHLAQVTRQSDRGADEAFWKRYKAFVSTAEKSCA